MPDFEFSRLVQKVIAADPSLKLKDIAEKMQMEYATLHARLIQRVHFRPTEVRSLLRVIPHQSLVNYFVEPTPYVLAERASASPGKADVVEWAHVSLFHIVDALRKIRAAMEDNFIDHRERVLLLEELREAEIALASLKAAVMRTNGDQDSAALPSSRG